jgi:hypothetical protein
VESGRKSYTLWTWARQDQERNFSIIDVRKGVFNLPEKQAPGGRVYAMTATGEVEKRIWIGTAVSRVYNHVHARMHSYVWNLGHTNKIYCFSSYRDL